MEQMLDKYAIKPMVGVIPANADPKQCIDYPDLGFWIKVKKWKTKKWAIALHGYNHCYISVSRGINPLWPRSEFAGLSLDIQKEKIIKGLEVLATHDIHPQYFFAPSHTFDENTLIALKECSDIRIISDTIATKPYKKGEFVFFPQLGGHCMNIPLPGIWTFCLHPSMMNEEEFLHTERFLKDNADKFIRFDDINLSTLKHKSLFSRGLSIAYFAYRWIRRL